MKTKTPSRWQRLLDDWRCRHTVRRWRRANRHQARRGRLAARLRALPYWHETGDILYTVGFAAEYAALRAGRFALRLARWLLHSLTDLVLALLRPLAAALPAAPGPGHLAGRLAGGAVVAAALAGFWGLTRFVLAQPRLLLVSVNGETIGYVANEQVLDNAQAVAADRIQNARAALAAAGTPADDADWQLSPSYTLAITRERPMNQSELVDALLRSSGGELVEATAVYLDGDLRFVTTEGDHLRSYLQSLLTPYEDVYDPNQQVSFAHGLTLSDGLFLTDSVQPYGDVIAQLQADGQALQVSTIERRSYTESIPYDTVTEESAEYAYGDTVVVQPGADGLREVTQDVIAIDGVTTELRTVSVQTLQAPVTEQVVTGTKLKDWMYGEVGGNTFVWPVPQYRQVSRWMGGSHTGTDIAAPAGTPIIASAAGTVSTVHYWNGIVTQGDYNSYGNYVVIDHENGYRTLYGHMTYFIVAEGEHVEQGQVIGYVGETGYAFGAHLHFEMFGPNGRFNAHTVFPDAPRRGG